MPAIATAYEHLSFDDGGDPIFAGTGFKALHLIREHVAYGWSAEELAVNHPQLSLGQVYAALAWLTLKGYRLVAFLFTDSFKTCN